MASTWQARRSTGAERADAQELASDRQAQGPALSWAVSAIYRCGLMSLPCALRSCEFIHEDSAEVMFDQGVLFDKAWTD